MDVKYVKPKNVTASGAAFKRALDMNTLKTKGYFKGYFLRENVRGYLPKNGRYRYFGTSLLVEITLAIF